MTEEFTQQPLIHYWTSIAYREWDTMESCELDREEYVRRYVGNMVRVYNRMKSDNELRRMLE